jgi:hypothetical protein
MKKHIVVLVLAVIALLAFTACATKPVEESNISGQTEATPATPGILHQFDDLGFSFSLPASWEGKYSISRNEHESSIGTIREVHVYHTATAEEFGMEIAGSLVHIAKLPVYDGMEDDAIGHVLAQTEEYVYVARYPQDSPYEYGSTDELAVQYMEMLDDLVGWDDNFIVKNFKLLD